MTITLKPYSSYKDSGVKWLGDVPEHWQVRRLKHLARLNPSKTETASRSGDELVTFPPVKNVSSSGQTDGALSKPLDEIRKGFPLFT